MSFTVDVKRKWQFTPNAIEFEFKDNSKEYVETAKHFEIKNVGDRAITIKNVYCNHSYFSMSGQRKGELEPGDKLDVIVSVKPEFIPENPFSVPVWTSANIGDYRIGNKLIVKINPPVISESLPGSDNAYNQTTNELVR